MQRKVVLQGEGRGNIFSHHLVKILGTRIFLELGGLISIGSLYYLTTLADGTNHMWNFEKNLNLVEGLCSQILPLVCYHAILNMRLLEVNNSILCYGLLFYKWTKKLRVRS